MNALIDTARSLGRQFALRGEEIEAARRLPADISTAMGDAGFYRMYVTERLGGLEVPPAVAVQVSEALAEGDASCAWVTFIAATTGLALGRMSDAAVGEMLQHPGSLVCGVFAANGVATKVAGGFQVSGVWPWGSGSGNADWVGGGCTIIEDGRPLTTSAGMPRNHMLFFPTAEVVSLDTWHVAGLSGTGSSAFEVKDLFVPEHRAAGYQVKAPPARPLFRYPAFGILAQGIAAVALGLARGSLTAFIDLAVQKGRGGASAPMAERPQVQAEVARAEARLRSARAFLIEAIEAAWAAAQLEGPPDPALTRDLRLAVHHATHESAGVVRDMYTMAGGAAVYRTSPLQRQFRDIHVATQHFMVAPNVLETSGRLLMGLEANTAGF